ncbi:hypothetical protein FOA52_004854 [Chlamydomonas sp. UWO 241]|nr:hypothetical protein FOA52_004854 [Chlamydomonas sp. UWO 241]
MENIAKNITLTFLTRWPWTHAQSLYNMCTDSGYATAQLKPFDYFGMQRHNFSAWVDHYAALRELPQNERSGHHHMCHNPWNFQTRLLSCKLQPQYDNTTMKAPDFPGGEPTSRLLHNAPHDVIEGELEPDLEEAVRVLDEIPLVGVLELMSESLCLVMFHKEGVLPAGCIRRNPLSGDVPQGGSVACWLYQEVWVENRSCNGSFNLPRVHITHGVPANATIHPDVRTMLVLADIVRLDFELYQATLHKLVTQLREVETKTNATLLCPHDLVKVEMLIALGKDIYDHIDGGATLSQGLHVYDACVKDLESQGLACPTEQSQRSVCYYLAGDVSLRTRINPGYKPIAHKKPGWKALWQALEAKSSARHK